MTVAPQDMRSRRLSLEDANSLEVLHLTKGDVNTILGGRPSRQINDWRLLRRLKIAAVLILC